MKKISTMKIVYIVTFLIGFLMIVLQLVILNINTKKEAKSTTNAYLVQTETIIENNDHEEEVLLASLKEDYIVLAKAVSYYLDKSPEAVNDIEELNKICSLMSIDEINIFDDTGTIFASSEEENLGYSFDDGEQIGYFKPMLEDKTLSMCQDVTPNTAFNKLMMYAITWNEEGTQMVQIGIEPTRLIKELAANEIKEVVKDIALDDNMSIIIADVTTFEIIGANNEDYIEKSILDVTSLKLDDISNNFLSNVKLESKSNNYFCSVGVTDEYVICVLLSNNQFVIRTLESLFIVLIYLLIAFVAIVFIFKKLVNSKEAVLEHLKIFESMSEIYYSLHLVNLEKNTAVEYSAKNQVKDVFNKNAHNDAAKLMVGIMHATMSDEYLEKGLEFTNINTLAERMRGKKIISMELLGKNVGWIRMSFITFEEKDGIPLKVIITTQIIDEEKKHAEMLYQKSYVDELTGCFNRRAYNDDTPKYENDPLGPEFIYISFDINGLKTVNDTLGHEAGDELICGATLCMKNSFSRYGKIYRTGGDEFVGLIQGDSSLMEKLSKEFEHQISNYKGKYIDKISVSYGYVLSSEMKEIKICDMACLADKRMYEAKEKYYKDNGIERRKT